MTELQQSQQKVIKDLEQKADHHANQAAIAKTQIALMQTTCEHLYEVIGRDSHWYYKECRICRQQEKSATYE